jgi:hypothetical protein
MTIETGIWTVDKQAELCDAVLKSGMARTPIQIYFVSKCKKSRAPLDSKAVGILRAMVSRNNIESVLKSYIDEEN